MIFSQQIVRDYSSHAPLRMFTSGHSRRINTEEKAKVVVAVWRAEFIQILAALAILHWTIGRIG